MKKYLHIDQYRTYLAGSFWKRLLFNGKQLVRREYAAIRSFMRLLIQWLMGKDLSAENRQLFRKQLMNYGRIIQLAAILALPFGTLVLILIVKFIPLNLFPTAFVKFSEVPLDKNIADEA